VSRISTSSSGGNVNIQDTNGNAITSTNGALNVNASSDPAGFNSITPGTGGQVSVTTVSTTLLNANPNRKYAHVVNNSNDEIFIQYASAAALNQGIRIPSGGFYTIESNNLWLGIVNAIGVTNPQLIDVLEGE